MVAHSNRALFIDRDGVINQSLVRDGRPYAPRMISDVVLLPTVVDALVRSRQNGFFNIVVTNQPDIDNRLQTWETIRPIHVEMLKRLAIDAIYVCPHSEKTNCGCRKPRPGLIRNAAEDWDIDIENSYLIGDRWKDISAGQTAGCKANFFIDYNYDEARPAGDYMTVQSLKDAVEIIESMTK